MRRPLPPFPLYRALGALAAAVVPTGALAQTPDRVLSEATIHDGDQCAVVGISLNAPVRLISSSPPGFGTELRIRVAAIEGNDVATMTSNREFLRAPTSDTAAISRIEFEGDAPEGPTLAVTFSHPVNFKLTQGADFRSFVIAVSKGKPDKECVPTPHRPDSVARSAKDAPLPAPSILPTGEPDKSVSPEDRALLAQARATLTGGDNQQAISLLTKYLTHVPGPAGADAQELLGIARERNEQFTHAKVAYQDYLKLVPDGPGADRVRQRLSTLIAKTTPKRAETGGAQPTQRGGGQAGGVWNVSGSLSTYYMRDESYLQIADTATHSTTSQTDTNLNQELTAADAFATYSSPDVKVKMRATGTYTNDFRKGRRDVESLSALYIEATSKKTGLYGRIGRQTISTGGVLGRFDGVVVSAPVMPMVKLQLVVGSPVDMPRNLRLNLDRYFYGVSMPIGRIANALDLDLYAIEQRNGGFDDRRAVGAEARYVKGGRAVFAAIDYDIHFNDINFGMVNGSWGYGQGGAINFAFDYRKAPLLFTSNAVIGQSVFTLNQLKVFYSEAEIKQLAMDRSAVSQSLNFGISHPLSQRFTVNSDITIAHMSGTPESGDVPAMKATKVEVYTSTQLVTNSVFKDGDMAIVGLRYANTTTANRWVVDFNMRYPVTKALRINPGVAFVYRANRANTGDEYSVQPMIRGTYTTKSHIQFEPEVGMEWTRDKSSFGQNTITGYHVYMGVRRDF